MSPTGQLLVSGYTEAPYGAGPGLARYSLAADGTVGERLARGAGVVNPSFALDAGSVLLAVQEKAEGGVVAVDPETLAVLGRVPSGGADPCHLLLLNGDVWVANYSSGTASVTPLAAVLASTTAAPPVLRSHPGTGPVADRQAESHAHQVTATPWDTVLVSDLGADRVDEYAVGSGKLLASAELPPGAGPRHVAIKGDFLLVAGELDGFLHVLRRTDLDAASGHHWLWLFKAPLAASAADIAAAGQFLPSHIQLSDDGTKLYAAVRGPNTFLVLDVAGLDGDNPGRPAFLAEVPSGGDWPRHFAVGSNLVYVANQLSNNVAVLALDADGLPGAEVVQIVEFGSPACILLG